MSPTTPKARSRSKATPGTVPAPTTVGNLTPDEVDAVLRDPNVPGDVRVMVAGHYSAQRYLKSVKFTKDGDGVTHVTPAGA